MSAPYGSVGQFSDYQARDRFLSWGPPPHNPHEGKDRPAFSWPAFYRYAAGKIDVNGNPVMNDDTTRRNNVCD